MIALRTLLPGVRQFIINPAIPNKSSLLNQSLKCYSSSKLPSIKNKQLTRTFASDTNPDETLIYQGSLAPRMKAVKVFSLTTSLTGLAAQPILMEQGMKIGGTGMAVALCTVAGFFTFVTPLLLHFITKKYVTEIHYNAKTDEYIATTISILLFKIKTKFRPSDVKVPDVPGMFTSFKVKDKPLFVEPTLFENTDHYVKIMGFDKPIDFKLDLQPDDSAGNKSPPSHNKDK
ncbi:transmembrane protein 70 homolog, mitochondrial [Episyrphus balteatus]|uniref:transmembrane protein 70 homolog, mitochondrial n=1 Tax=Episyrphus balteatus TaxID=286459 RepID=UPI00248539E5|nr:transmembrane protein 70 homolog, mitochondrial [Episyrphus balteatus]